MKLELLEILRYSSSHRAEGQYKIILFIVMPRTTAGCNRLSTDFIAFYNKEIALK